MDWPMCVSRVEFLYINTATSQVKFEKTFTDPFAKMMEFDLDDKLIPCSDNFDYVTKVNIASMSRGGFAPLSKEWPNWLGLSSTCSNQFFAH